MNEKQIIQKLQSKDKNEILDLPMMLINEKSINLNALIAIAAKEKVLSKILAMIDIANLLERKNEFETVLAAHYNEKLVSHTTIFIKFIEIIIYYPITENALRYILVM